MYVPTYYTVLRAVRYSVPTYPYVLCVLCMLCVLCVLCVQCVLCVLSQRLPNAKNRR